MHVHELDEKTEGQKFKLVKYFAWACFIVLAIFSFPFSMIVSQQAKEILIKSHEDYSRLIGENLGFHITENFVKPIVLRGLYGGRIQLSDPGQYKWLDKIVNDAIHGFQVESLSIYDINKNVIAYSTDPALIGNPVGENLGYQKALQGEHFSGLITQRSSTWKISEILGAETKLKTFVPLRGHYDDPAYISGVFELTLDITEKYKAITRFQFIIVGLSILIMGLIFIVLLLVVQKAEIMRENQLKEQRELQNQLHQAERLAALGEMVAGVSHEIKNPLGIIRSTAELLTETTEAGEQGRRLSTVIMEESNRLNNIVTEFLDFARPPILNIQAIRLEDILQKNLYFLQSELEKRGIRVQSNLEGRTFELQADPDLLYRAFLNIMLNAMQAMDHNGILQIRAEKEKNQHVIEIEDNGSGITSENMKKIFNPFFTTKEKGTGLGLSIVRKIIEGHQGTITLESNPGKGTIVKVHLPR